MRVFITDLEAYNNGLLVGNWYTLPMGEDTLEECIQEVLTLGRKALKSSHNHEEYFITDWECDYKDIGEYENLEALNTLADEVEALDDYDMKRYTAMRDNGYSHEEALEGYDDVSLYEDTTLEDLAYMFVAEGLYGEINPSIINYIDYEAIARDLSFVYTEVNNDVIRVA